LSAARPPATPVRSGPLVLTAQDWVDADAMKRSMTLLAEEVMPKVNAAIGSQAAAD